MCYRKFDKLLTKININDSKQQVYNLHTYLYTYKQKKKKKLNSLNYINSGGALRIVLYSYRISLISLYFFHR